MASRPVGHKYTPRHTPYHIVQLTIALLKSTFNMMGDEEFPFKYYDDLDKSGIAIDTEFNPEARIIGQKPTIAIGRGQLNAGQLALGDVEKQNFPQQQYLKTNYIQSSLQFRISARSHAECDMLSNELFNFLIACRTMLPKVVHLQQISSISMGPVSQSEQDDKIYVCSASLQYTMQYHWYHIETEDVLASLHIFLRAQNTETEPEREIYEEDPYNT